MSETLQSSIDRLRIERMRLIPIICNIEMDLRAIRLAQESAGSALISAALNRQHRCALASHSRAQLRLRELNTAIKAGNIQLQIETTRAARAAKKASKARQPVKEHRHGAD